MRYRRTDIVRKVFSRVRNGYDESEVDVFLDELAEDADVCLAEIARLKEQNAQLIAHSRKLEQLLETAKEQKRTQEDMRLEIDAERRELLERTRLQARSMVDEARRQARAIVDDAYREADQMAANARVLPREYLEQEPTADPPAFRMRGSFLPPPQAGGDVPAAQMDGRTNGGEEQPAPVRLEVSERIPRNPEPAATAPAEEGRRGGSAGHETPAGGAAAQEGPRDQAGGAALPAGAANSEAPARQLEACGRESFPQAPVPCRSSAPERGPAGIPRGQKIFPHPAGGTDPGGAGSALEGGGRDLPRYGLAEESGEPLRLPGQGRLIQFRNMCERCCGIFFCAHGAI